jgi:hypothetical protein
MNKNNEGKNKVVENGRIKGTSAFNIQQADSVDELSWSNNNFSSTQNQDSNETKSCNR